MAVSATGTNGNGVHCDDTAMCTGSRWPASVTVAKGPFLQQGLSVCAVMSSHCACNTGVGVKCSYPCRIPQTGVTSS